MQNRQDRTAAMFGRVEIFLNQYPIAPAPPLLVRMREELKRLGREIDHLQLRQNDGGKHLSSPRAIGMFKRVLRQDWMIPLARTARPLLKHSPVPAAVFVIPHASTQPIAVATHALRMAKALKPMQGLLADAGYSKEWMREFHARAAQLATSAKERIDRREGRVKATAAVAAAIAKGMRNVNVIEGIVFGKFGAQSVERQMWRRSRRVSQRMGRPLERSRERRLRVVS